MAYENIKCYGWHAEGIEGEDMPDVLVLMNRSDIFDIIRMLKMNAEHSDNYGVIRDTVYLIDALHRVLNDHKKRWDEDKEDLE